MNMQTPNDNSTRLEPERFRIRYRDAAMATTFEVILDGDRDERELNLIGEAAYNEVLRLEKMMSAHQPDSDLSWINQRAHTRPIKAPPELFEMLLMARDLWRETEGAFDITVGPLVKCWGFFVRKGRVPTDEELEIVRSVVGMDKVELDPENRTVRFLEEGMELNPGGIGKGYAIDRVVAMLRERGVSSAIAHLGGSTVYAIGTPPISEDGWRVGVRPGGREAERIGSIVLRDAAYSTSGDHKQHFEHEGRRYGHVMDPRTGEPVTGARAACCLSESAARADALSTAFTVMDPEETRGYCANNRESAVLVTESGDGDVSLEEIGCTVDAVSE